MDKKIKGIGLILFAILFFEISDMLQGYLWKLHIGVDVPWAIMALLMGVLGLIFILCHHW